MSLVHSLLAITVPFVTFSAYSTEFEFQHSIKLSGATRLFASPTLLHLTQISGLPDDCIYILEGDVEGRISYATLVDRVRQTKIPRLPVRPAKRDTLAYLVFSSGTTGLPKGERAFLDYRILCYFDLGVFTDSQPRSRDDHPRQSDFCSLTICDFRRRIY